MEYKKKKEPEDDISLSPSPPPPPPSEHIKEEIALVQHAMPDLLVNRWKYIIGH